MQTAIRELVQPESFILDPSLVLYLPLYKRDGLSFMSDDAYGHLCTVTGALWTPQGRDFDGVDDYIEIPASSTQLDFTSGDFSIELWAKRTITGEQNLLVRGLFNADGYYLRDSLGKLQFRTNQNTTSQVTEADPGTTLNTWNHILVTRSGTSVIIYVNSIDATTTSGSHTNPAVSSRTLKIATYDDLSSYWKGNMGEVRIYNRVLTPLEIQGNYLAGKWRYQ